MKIAVITGASSGMGREFAIQLSHEANFDEMWVIARRKEALESLKDQVCRSVGYGAARNQGSGQLRRLREIWTVRPDSFAGLHEYD